MARSVAAGPLEPGTLYHWRLVADSPLLVEPAPSDAEELRTFAEPEVDESCANKASRIGSGAYLPDCRAYEMVSPLDKAGGDIRVLDTSLAEPAVHEQSSLDGEKLAYGSIRSFGGAVSAPYTSQYVARRVAGKEWETHPINPPRGAPIDTAIEQFDTEFKAFSDDLCQAWFESFAEPPLSAEALGGILQPLPTHATSSARKRAKAASKLWRRSKRPKLPAGARNSTPSCWASRQTRSTRP